MFKEYMNSFNETTKSHLRQIRRALIIAFLIGIPAVLILNLFVDDYELASLLANALLGIPFLRAMYLFQCPHCNKFLWMTLNNYPFNQFVAPKECPRCNNKLP
jgi:hypothetical protein